MISVRALAEAGLVWSGIPRWVARGRRGRTLVLAYHNIAPDGAAPTGDASLHLSQSRFAQQLDMLAALCDVVPLASILVEAPRAPRPRVAITFDDAYHGALTLGAAELRARRLPATMFVAPGLLGESSFWWDALAGSNGLADAVRARALGELRGEAEAVRRWAADAGHALRDVPPWARPGTEPEVVAWARDDRLAVGAHTWRHPNLARLTASEVQDELVRPLHWLRDRLPAVIPWLTYPYGHATTAVAAAACAAGYHAALAVAGGWMREPPGDRYWLPRLNVPAGLTPHGFRLRLAGVVGNDVALAQQVASAE